MNSEDPAKNPEAARSPWIVAGQGMVFCLALILACCAAVIAGERHWFKPEELNWLAGPFLNLVFYSPDTSFPTIAVGGVTLLMMVSFAARPSYLTAGLSASGFALWFFAGYVYAMSVVG